MTHAEYGPFQVGAFSSPLTASLANTLLEDADPALYAALGFWRGVLELHLGARWSAAAAAAGLTQAPSVVGVAVPYDVGPYLTQVAYALPILACYPVSEVTSEHTRAHYRLTATWILQWILPPLTPAQHLQLYPFLRAAGKVLLDRTEQGYDPGYESGEQVFQAGGLASIKVREIRYGRLEGKARGGQDAQLYFPCVEFEIEAVEQRAGVASDELAGIDASIAVKDDSGQQTVMEIAQDYQP